MINSSHRRNFLKRASLVTLGAFPAAFHRSASAMSTDESNTSGRILVVIEMSGGNDGLNTVVPFADEGYQKHRKELLLPTDRLLKLDQATGLHPAMRAAVDLFEDGRLAIVQGVGYPNPDRSHEVSMSIWQSAQLDNNKPRNYGWLGRAMDGREPESLLSLSNRSNHSPEMIFVGDQAPPLAIRARTSTTLSFANLNELKLPADHPWATMNTGKTSSDLAKYVSETAYSAALTAKRLREPNRRSGSSGTGASYPATGLSNRLQSIARLIKAGFSTSIYYTVQAGYDTHVLQLPTHDGLLREFSQGLKAFLDDLSASGLSDRVTVLGFSEFGRRVAENGDRGTDHGTAGPVFLAGPTIKPGLIGQQPNLQELHDGDPRMTTDFRDIYTAILRDWFKLRLGDLPTATGAYRYFI